MNYKRTLSKLQEFFFYAIIKLEMEDTMKRNKKGSSPILILEFDECNIKELVCSIINMSSIFLWNSNYKDAMEDEELGNILDVIQIYIDTNYKGDE